MGMRMQQQIRRQADAPMQRQRSQQCDEVGPNIGGLVMELEERPPAGTDAAVLLSGSVAAQDERVIFVVLCSGRSAAGGQG